MDPRTRGVRPQAAALLALVLSLWGCATVGPGDTPVASEAPESTRGLASEMGLASWYGKRHHGRLTASGVVFDQNALTAAHRTLPFGTRVRVTNLENGRQVVVQITDRGPYRSRRVIDLSRKAAQALGMFTPGVVRVRLETLPEAAALP
jgi:rare lipoprotein A